jgi:hypothetical protein
MEDAFCAKVRAAAAAAWWTFLIAVAFLLVQWLLYLLVMSVKPGLAPSLWGPDATWDEIHAVWFQGLFLLKLSLWPLGLVAIWLTLWARQLRTSGSGV